MQLLMLNVDLWSDEFWKNCVDMFEQIGVMSGLLEQVVEGGGEEVFVCLCGCGKMLIW